MPGSTVDMFLNTVPKFSYSTKFDKFNEAQIMNDLEDNVEEGEQKSKGEGFKEFLETTRKIDEEKTTPHMTEE